MPIFELKHSAWNRDFRQLPTRQKRGWMRVSAMFKALSILLIQLKFFCNKIIVVIYMVIYDGICGTIIAEIIIIRVNYIKCALCAIFECEWTT